jgi:hypothetical protein
MTPLSSFEFPLLRHLASRIKSERSDTQETKSTSLSTDSGAQLDPKPEVSILVGVTCASVCICFLMLASIHILLD